MMTTDLRVCYLPSKLTAAAQVMGVNILSTVSAVVQSNVMVNRAK